jgi:predicted enzyme related to lactoylglutathione lyase
MHKSKLAGFIIDCKTRDLDSAAQFWSAALGMERQPLPGAEGEKYQQLSDSNLDLHVEVQMVSHPSRVHLDVEADDVEAEVRRLEALGAKRIEQVSSWWVLEAPTGQRFCVVKAASANFEKHARQWP